MANNVFANNREISCKKADGKSICAFPDVCMTPPENPATPPGVPVPYPNTGFASDTSSGSKQVKISGQEVMLKNKSYYKKSTGDEAGCAAKKGVISSKNKGKVYFRSWSPNVKIEGLNVVRHLDMTTHNHMSEGPNEGIPWPHVDRMSLMNLSEECNKEKEKIDNACGNPIDPEKAKCPDPSAVNAAKAEHQAACKMDPGSVREELKAEATKKVNAALENYALEIHANECTRALRCALVPYNKGSKSSGRSACCPHQTPDHLVPAAHFGPDRGAGHPKYNADQAPCMCVSGGAHTATHGLLGRERTRIMKKKGIAVNKDTPEWTVEQACDCGAESAANVSGCSKECLASQLKQGHKDMKIDPDEKICTKKESVGDTNQELDAMQNLMNEYPINFSS